MNQPQIGYLAKKFRNRELPLQVLERGEGFYIGTFCSDDGPMTRESTRYWPTREDAQSALETGEWVQVRYPYS